MLIGSSLQNQTQGPGLSGEALANQPCRDIARLLYCLAACSNIRLGIRTVNPRVCVRGWMVITLLVYTSNRSPYNLKSNCLYQDKKFFHQPQNLAKGWIPDCILIREQKGRDDKKKKRRGRKITNYWILTRWQILHQCFHIGAFTEIWHSEGKKSYLWRKRELYQSTNSLHVRWWEPLFRFPPIFNHNYNIVVLIF